MFEKLDDDSKTRLAGHFFNLMQIFVGQTQAILQDEDLSLAQTVGFMQKEMKDFITASQEVVESELATVNPHVIN
jgi:hypothetical protein|tara:strand:+ start:1564 stop:1788 length:225 start_codon:yes stop_codon:yes gene_type:complete